VSIVTVLLVVLFPVSDSVRRVLHLGPSPETDTSTLKTGGELVCVPVRISQLILHAKNLRHLMITFSYYLSPCVHSTQILGKLYVPCPSAFHLLRVVTPHTPTFFLDRYSNTLLVFLNNRISIRDASVARGGIVQSPAGTCPGTGRSEATTDIVLMDMEKEKHENALEVRELLVGETRSRDRVISESRMTLLHVVSYF